MIGSATDPVAIVTGGSSAIGRDVSLRLARSGYAIVVVYLDDQHRAEASVEQILGAGSAALAVRADLTDDLDVERLFTETIAAFAAVDVLVHTTPCGASVLFEHAARHLRRGAAIVSVSPAEPITPALAQLLRERDITVNGAPPGVEPSGGDDAVADRRDD
jgi:short-subunit dehydrogenase